MSAKRGMSGRLIAALLVEEYYSRLATIMPFTHGGRFASDRTDYLAFLRSVATHTGKTRTSVTRAYASAVAQIEGR